VPALEFIHFYPFVQEAMDLARIRVMERSDRKAIVFKKKKSSAGLSPAVGRPKESLCAPRKGLTHQAHAGDKPALLFLDHQIKPNFSSLIPNSHLVV
jgi:hypothetical protein